MGILVESEDLDSLQEFEATEAVTADEDEWTDKEKKKLFKLLARYGRYNKTIIAKHINTKSQIETIGYTDLLEQQFNRVKHLYPDYFLSNMKGAPQAKETLAQHVEREEKRASWYIKALNKQLRALDLKRKLNRQERNQLRLFHIRRGECIARNYTVPKIEEITVITKDAWLEFHAVLREWLRVRIGGAMLLCEERARGNRKIASEVSVDDMEQTLGIHAYGALQKKDEASARNVLERWQQFEVSHPGFRDEMFDKVAGYMDRHRLVPSTLSKLVGEPTISDDDTEESVSEEEEVKTGSEAEGNETCDDAPITDDPSSKKRRRSESEEEND